MLISIVKAFAYELQETQSLWHLVYFFIWQIDVVWWDAEDSFIAVCQCQTLPSTCRLFILFIPLKLQATEKPLNGVKETDPHTYIYVNIYEPRFFHRMFHPGIFCSANPTPKSTPKGSGYKARKGRKHPGRGANPLQGRITNRDAYNVCLWTESKHRGQK